MDNITDIVLEANKHGYLRLNCEPETKSPSNTPILYTCPICKASYETLEEAEACRDQPKDFGRLSVGDILVMPGYWRGYKVPNMEWCACVTPPEPKSSNHFDRLPKYIPWFVVTYIGPDDHDPHRMVATLCSLYDVGEFGLVHGWNPANADGHHAMYVVYPELKKIKAGHRWYKETETKMLSLTPSETVIREAQELVKMGIKSSSLI